MITQEENLVEHYSATEDFSRDFRNANLFQLMATLVRGKVVVDIGSGAGFFLGMLKERGKDVLGIEPNEGMRELSAKVNSQVRVIPGSAEEIDTLITAPVESITMLDVLEHIENDTEQVKRIWSALPPGGEFILVVPAYPSFYGARDVAMGHYRRYSTASLKKLLSTNGFTVEHIRYWNALGVLPYLVSEKILRRPLRVQLREGNKKGVLGELLWNIVDFWVREVENRFNFGFGLSIICVAKKKLD